VGVPSRWHAEVIWMAQYGSWVFILALFIYDFLIQGPSRYSFRRAVIVDNWTRLADALLDFLAYLAWQILPIIFVASDWIDVWNYRLPAPAVLVGGVLLAASLFVLWRAYRDLGANWSPKLDVRQEQQLVTTGIYARIRHPIYAGMFLWAIAQPLLIWNWLAGPAFGLVFLPLYVTRMPREEQMMLEHFGDEYRQYMLTSGRLLPRRPGNVEPGSVS
jgi:protein-S-isoprenylcysteine O-methyltransferase Ste14